MTECTVVCHSGCRNDQGNGPKVWRWLCEDCAQEHLDKHRRETGHTDLNLNVASDVTLHSLRRQIGRAADLPFLRRW